MTANEKRFPLNLSSVVDQRGALRKSPTAMPQTAMQNAAIHTKNLKTNLPTLAKTVVTSSSPTTTTTSRRVPDRISTSKALPSSDMGMVSDKIRQAMVARVAQQGVKDTLVLAALEAIPRHLFIESGLASQAYIDASLPIGHHQTISQPYIVARMTEILRNGKNLQRVLEIGTGCGYQAAVLSLLAQAVYSIEIVPELCERAAQRLDALGYHNVHVRLGDGSNGWPEQAPFDGILVAAAASSVPDALLAQLAPGGRLVIPVRILPGYEVLQVIQKSAEGKINTKDTIGVRFVPLVSH